MAQLQDLKNKFHQEGQTRYAFFEPAANTVSADRASSGVEDNNEKTPQAVLEEVKITEP